jgi:FAD:protein FMN transferase
MSMILLVLVGLVTPPPAVPLAHRTATRFTTNVTLTVPATTPAVKVDAAFARVLGEFDRLDALLSEWRPDSPISRLNAAQGAWTPLPQEAFALLQQAQRLTALTEGGFDPTFKTLSGLWRFDADAQFTRPARADIDARLPGLGAARLELEPEKRAARLTHPKTRLGLGGIAKGYAVERAAALLRDHDILAFCLGVGGETYCAGEKAPGVPWVVGVRDPRDPKGLIASLPLRDAAFTTSGDYERFRVVDGVRYHHILDPRTGAPARGCRSVTILAGSATEADALSTGVFVMGPTRGMALVESRPDVEAVIVDADGAMHVSSGLKKTLWRKDP